MFKGGEIMNRKKFDKLMDIVFENEWRIDVSTGEGNYATIYTSRVTYYCCFLDSDVRVNLGGQKLDEDQLIFYLGYLQDMIKILRGDEE